MVWTLVGVGQLFYTLKRPTAQQSAVAAEHLVKYTVKLSQPGSTGWGTGFHVKAPTRKIYILTNRHVCGAGSTEMLARSEMSDRAMPRKVLERSSKADLCIVEALPDQKEGLELAKSVNRFENAHVLGYPADLPISLSSGKILGESEVPQEADFEFCKLYAFDNKQYDFTLNPLTGKAGCVFTQKTLHTDIPVFFGNSGSAVVNEDMEVIGVIWGLRRERNMGLAVPLTAIKEFLKPY